MECILVTDIAYSHNDLLNGVLSGGSTFNELFGIGAQATTVDLLGVQRVANSFFSDLLGVSPLKSS